MLLLLEKMDEKLNLQTITITENITTAVLIQVDEKIKPILEENAKLKTEIDKLNRKIENLEANGKRNNLLIHGIPEQKDETEKDLKTVITTTLNEIDIMLKDEEIDRMQRLGKPDKGDGKIRPILLTTTTLQKKIQILKNKKKMKPNTYITQDLTKEAQIKKKERRRNEKKGFEKRKRSETPSPKTSYERKNNDPKVIKRDAFQYLRDRSHALPDKQRHPMENTGTTTRKTTAQ